MPQVDLILAIGQYAQAWHLGSLRRKTMTETVVYFTTEGVPAMRTNWPRPRKFDSDSETSPMTPSEVE